MRFYVSVGTLRKQRHEKKTHTHTHTQRITTYAATASFPFLPLPAVALVFLRAARFSPSQFLSSLR